MLVCPVRACHLPLRREAKRVVCEKGHSFDVARSGYINLLQPQDKRSKNPGDTPEAVAGRQRLHDLGVTGPLLRGIAELAAASERDVVLDAGCGDGFYLGTLQRETGFDGHGIDISTPAIEAAAKRFPSCEWIVANADRFIPYAEKSFSLILSITARMNAEEFRRVLRDDGRLLVAIPAPDDLIELRGVGKDRLARTVTTFESQFQLVGQQRVTTVAELEVDSVRDVQNAIYRPLQPSPPQAARVTFSLELLLFQPA